MRIERDFKEFIALLNRNKVKYLVVGGFAFSYYAEPRFTRDIDIFIESSVPNSENLLKALADFGFQKTGLTASDFQKPGQVIQLGYSPLRIDLVTSIDGVSFGTAWNNKTRGQYGDEPCFFISRQDLIRNKEASGRAQDLADLEKLKKAGS